MQDICRLVMSTKFHACVSVICVMCLCNSSHFTIFAILCCNCGMKHIFRFQVYCPAFTRVTRVTVYSTLSTFKMQMTSTLFQIKPFKLPSTVSRFGLKNKEKKGTKLKTWEQTYSISFRSRSTDQSWMSLLKCTDWHWPLVLYRPWNEWSCTITNKKPLMTVLSWTVLTWGPLSPGGPICPSKPGGP